MRATSAAAPATRRRATRPRTVDDRRLSTRSSSLPVRQRRRASTDVSTAITSGRREAGERHRVPARPAPTSSHGPRARRGAQRVRARPRRCGAGRPRRATDRRVEVPVGDLADLSTWSRFACTRSAQAFRGVGGRGRHRFTIRRSGPDRLPRVVEQVVGRVDVGVRAAAGDLEDELRIRRHQRAEAAVAAQSGSSSAASRSTRIGFAPSPVGIARDDRPSVASNGPPPRAPG